MSAQARFALLLVAVFLVMGAVWTWLPPSDASKAAIEEAIVSYESLDSVVWHPGPGGDAMLSPEAQDALVAERAAAWREVAEGDALIAAMDRDPDVVRSVAAERRRSPDDPYVVAAGGDVVLFDFRRRTLHGDVLVRAAVVTWVETGLWDQTRDEVVDVARGLGTSASIREYTVRQRDDTWVVVESAAPDGPPFSYDPRTGEYGTGG